MNGIEQAPINRQDSCSLEFGAPSFSCRCHDQDKLVSGHVGGRAITWCDGCGLFWTSSAEGQQERIQYYQDAYWHDFKDEQAGSARENIFTHALNRIEGLMASPGIMVDVGCGPGAFLEMSQARGWEVRGYDPSRLAVAQACGKGLHAVECIWPPCPLLEEQADVVTMINVLDHLPNPFEALEEAWRVLKVGGLLYVRVPNGPTHRRFAKILHVFGLEHIPVIHLYGFGARVFRHHLPKLGFEIEDIRTAPPSQQDSYAKCNKTKIACRVILKKSDRFVYALMKGLRLDRLAYGLSIEVLARKNQKHDQGNDA